MPEQQAAYSKAHSKHEWVVGIWADPKREGQFAVDARCRIPGCSAKLSVGDIEQRLQLTERSLTRMPRKR